MAKHRFLPMTEQDEKDMLDTIGVSSIDELFTDIPESIRFNREYDLKPAKSEPALLKELAKLASKNADSVEYASFFRGWCVQSLHSNCCR
ncbi:glycine dehydrogenase subunit 1 [Listeria cornellensis FSL F6-0969]|uniref:Glycine dehydrogenase subunit 1 n=1 Tax=Listeria cornellensis FSL F6-0969 TaxID=1265820 RepID=W7CDH0_9LIST|nr:glycine dehydrogenase subunit 1 [Listeria cornellensis FSL F6-0969]